MVNIWLILGKDMVIILGQYMVTLKQRQKPVRTASIAWSMVMVSVGLTYVGYGGDIYIYMCVCACVLQRSCMHESRPTRAFGFKGDLSYLLPRPPVRQG